ncbi:MAG: hypothetical protein JWM20_27 [Patescibacteria group bacterium]|nr:hypothetical protein [Patescibacteria group bacterium]
MKPSETTNFEAILNLPTKQEEFDIFTNYDMIAVFDRYLPLADYIIDEYACLSDEISIMVEETAYTALMGMIAQYRRAKAYETVVPFSQIVSRAIYAFMEEFEKEGKLYKISKSFVVK